MRRDGAQGRRVDGQARSPCLLSLFPSRAAQAVRTGTQHSRFKDFFGATATLRKTPSSWLWMCEGREGKGSRNRSARARAGWEG